MDCQLLLKNANLKNTPQRLCLLQVLSKHTHPTIDEIYEQVRAIYPSISLATVYKNLSVLIEANLVVEVSVSGKKSRYDIFERPHIHAVCNGCGAVTDLFEEDADLACYQSGLESKLGAKIGTINIVALLNSCKECVQTTECRVRKTEFA